MRIGIQQILVLVLIAAVLGSASVGIAEPGMLTVFDVSADWSGGGEDMHIDLGGFEARLGLLPEGGLGLNLLGDGKLLLAAEALTDEEGVLLSMDGLSRSYRLAFRDLIREMTGMDPAALDVRALAEILQRGTEIRSTDDSVRVRVPYTTVNELLEALCPFLSQTLDPYDYEELTQALERFRAEDAGFTLEALLTQTERGLTGQLSLLEVQGGRTAISPYVGLAFSLTSDDGASLLFSGEMVGDPRGTGTAMTLASVYGSWLRSPDGTRKLRFDVLWDESFVGELQPLLSVDGAITPEENGISWSFLYSEADYSGAPLTPYALLTGSALNTGNGLALHLELADCYGEETPVPYYALDLSAELNGEDTVLSFVYHELDYRSGELRPEASLTLTVHPGESESTVELTAAEADYRSGELRPIGRILAKKTARAEETVWTFSVFETDYRTDELVESLKLSFLLRQTPEGLEISGQAAERDYYEQTLVTALAFEGTLRDENGEKLAHLDFLTPDGSGNLACIARFDGRAHRDEAGAAAHAELSYDVFHDGNYVTVATLDAADGEVVSVDVQVTEDYGAHLSFVKSSGELELSFHAEDYSGALRAKAAVGALDLVRCEGDPETAVDILSLTDEQYDTLMRELRTATAHLVGYLYPAYIQATNGMGG